MLLAGEPSGDIQAAKLIESMKSIDNDLEFFGLGGDECQKQDMEIIAHVKDLALMGFLEVLPAIPRLKRLQRRLIKLCKERKPEAAILVDYPGFNLSLAPRIKKLGIKTIYYISPQFWAWHESRVKKVKKYIDRMIVFLPFEKPFYEKHDVDVDYVGHPFVDTVEPELPKNEFLSKYKLDDQYLLLMPGSRQQEVKRHLPLMIDIAKMFPDYNWAYLRASNISDEFIDRFKKEIPKALSFSIIDDDNYAAMSYAHFALVGSGSATLECAVAGTPLFVVYKTSQISYLLAKFMVLVDYIGLVNLVASEEVAREFIQKNAEAGKIASELDEILKNPKQYGKLKSKIQNVKSKLGEGHATDKAAKIILDIIEE